MVRIMNPSGSANEENQTGGISSWCAIKQQVKLNVINGKQLYKGKTQIMT